MLWRYCSDGEEGSTGRKDVVAHRATSFSSAGVVRSVRKEEMASASNTLSSDWRHFRIARRAFSERVLGMRSFSPLSR